MKAMRDDSDRREQVLAVTRRRIIASRSLNISLNDIAEELAISRSLIYVYFESVAQIIDELFGQEASLFDHRINEIKRQSPVFRDRMIRLFNYYLEHLVAHGQLAYIVLRERNQDSPLGAENSRRFRRILLKLSRDMVRSLHVTPREAFVLLELLAAIPESLGRLVRSHKLDLATAQGTSERLVGAALDALKLGKA